MHDDLTALLERTAIDPTQAIDPTALTDAARQRNRRRQLLGGLAVVALVGAAIPIGASLTGQLTPDPAFIVTDPADNPAWSASIATSPAIQANGQTSQTPEDAARDQVPAALAALPLSVRAPGGMGLDLPDGRRWQDGPAGFALALRTGDCAPDTLCRGQYYEFQLIGADGDLELAHALPGVSPDWISIGPDGDLYGADRPDSADADGVIFRLGTSPGDRTVRVFPGGNSWYAQDGDPASPLRIDGSVWLPDGWIVADEGADRSHLDTNTFSWSDGQLILANTSTDFSNGEPDESTTGPRYILDARTLERLDGDMTAGSSS